jgi:hypothetical protein
MKIKWSWNENNKRDIHAFTRSKTLYSQSVIALASLIIFYLSSSLIYYLPLPSPLSPISYHLSLISYLLSPISYLLTSSLPPTSYISYLLHLLSPISYLSYTFLSISQNWSAGFIHACQQSNSRLFTD